MKQLFACLFMVEAACFCALGPFAALAEGSHVLDEVPVISLEDKYLICDEQALLLDAGSEGMDATYRWENLTANSLLSTDRFFEVSKSGNYRLTVTVEGESASKNFVVAESFTPKANIASKTYTICKGTVMTLDAGNPGARFIWLNDNSGDTISTSQTATIAFKGKYSLAVMTPCGTSVSVFIVDEINYPDLKVVPSTAYLCVGDSVTVDAKNFDARAFWIDTETGDTIATTKRVTLGKVGDYELILYNQCDTVSTIVTIAPRALPQINLEDEMFICNSLPITLDAGISDAAYEWVNVETRAVVSNSQSIVVDKSGLFSIKVTDACGVAFDTVKVSKINAPDINLKSEYLICDGAGDEIVINLFGVSIEWSKDGETLSSESRFTPAEAGNYVVTVSNGCGHTSRNFSIVESFIPEISLPAEINMMALNGSVVLDAGNEGANYKWIEVADGAIIGESQTVQITRSGQYILGVTTPCGGKEKVISVNLITAIGDASKREFYVVFPNPATSTITIEKFGPVDREVSLSLYNIAGKKVLHLADAMGFGQGKKTFTVDVSTIPRGIYVLQVTGEEEYRTRLLLQ